MEGVARLLEYLEAVDKLVVVDVVELLSFLEYRHLGLPVDEKYVPGGARRDEVVIPPAPNALKV
jgi:hypothetical protein